MLAPVIENMKLMAPLELGKMNAFPQYDCTQDGIHVFSNDGSMPPDVLENISKFDRGLALHIGSGATFSLIDKHNLYPVVIDRDLITLSMQKITELAILGSDTAAEATDCIVASGEEIFDIKPDVLYRGLQDEAKNHQLGRLHWLYRFPEVKDAVGQKTLTYILSDVRDIFLAHALNLTAAETGPIQFFNLTNVHNHITGQTMDFVRSMPISPDAVLLFSDWWGMQRSHNEAEVALRRNVGDLSIYLNFSKYAMLDK